MTVGRGVAELSSRPSSFFRTLDLTDANLIRDSNSEDKNAASIQVRFVLAMNGGGEREVEE